MGGTNRYLDLVNLSSAVHFFMKSCARGPVLMFSSLLPAITGSFNLRSAPVTALHVKYAIAAGIPRGEAAAARSNFEAILKIFLPQLFSRLYLNSRKSRSLMGMPYLLCAFLVLTAHGTLALVTKN